MSGQGLPQAKAKKQQPARLHARYCTIGTKIWCLRLRSHHAMQTQGSWLASSGLFLLEQGRKQRECTVVELVV